MKPPSWPQKSVEKYYGENFCASSQQKEWMNLQFIERHTGVINSFIYAPFLVISLHIVSLSSLFDRWSWIWPLFIVFGLHSLWALICAVALNRTAKQAKNLALDRLRQERMKELKDTGKREQISVVIEAVEKFKKGAFAPLLQQPVIGAVLMPLGGVGTAVLMESFLKFT
jgi:hypothetical protein